ncbi:orotate phosphoribosyltransferase [Synechococcus sp. PCC 7502]|uniref:orotate phosphoribosyltransferase n=1 Tax=Synechococcus sp. PCC 7502 TaxID=1173263 RepID=UPI00029FB37C|nr:orotate phosphoribosyltransferase [Synechococcus sp. PCC 7502]AFY73907.1 orotate phosphoribosyltransferase [Synechococcus sp. PCC 7502]
MLAITEARTKLLDLICTLAYKSGNFILSSGQPSSYYINGKQVTLHPYGALWTGQILLSMLPQGVKAVAGLTLGADPLVSAVSVVSAYQDTPVSALIVRKQVKAHGTQAWIEGVVLPPNSEVVVLEDVVTTGSSAMLAVEKLKEAGYQVNLVLTLVDRLQGGAECFAAAGLDFKAVFTIAEIQDRAAQIA